MNKHYTLDVYDYNREKICGLYDSNIELVGQAYDIQITEEINGYHTLTFNLPYIVDYEAALSSSVYAVFGEAIFGTSRFGSKDITSTGGKNFRWDYLKNEYLIRYSCDGQNIWFVATKPVKSKSGKKIIGSATCSGTESLLKTRNIYMTFDDENGIGTMDELMTKIMTGTGWTYSPYRYPGTSEYGLSDQILENDGVTEKVRSLKSDGKQGVLGLINTVCNIFKTRPVFDTDEKVVYIKALSNRDQVFEGTIGRNLTAMTINNDSGNICTRVYVEGEYGDFGYVGIDDVKVDENGVPDENGTPWGLPFVVNFDYYRSIGVFKQQHETALSNYLRDIRKIKADIMEAGVVLTSIEDNVNTMIGQCKVAVYYTDNGFVTPTYTYGDMTIEQMSLHMGDEIVILYRDKTYIYGEWSGDSSVLLENSYGVAKFVTKPLGSIGADEVQIEAKKKTQEQLQAKIDRIDPEMAEKKQDVIDEYLAEIRRLDSEINSIYAGTNDALGLYNKMYNLMNSFGLLYELDEQNTIINTLNAQQDDIESTFISAMGYLLRDGYWSNNNYIVGQEEFLYRDAIDMAQEMSKPETSYSVSYVRTPDGYDVPIEEIEMNSIFKIYDKELNIDDKMFVKKRAYGVDNKKLGSIEVSNQDITLTGNDLGSLLSRMSQLADLIEQKNALYERAKAISSSGTLYANRLNGQIDVLKTQLVSAVSNWHTDDNGNIMFVSADESSAMMLCGAGFMLANGKDDHGNWNWRSFGTGNGFTADEIVAGFISADRIEANSITVNHLSSDVGSYLDLTSNEALIASIESISGEIAAQMQLTPENFEVMFDTYVAPGVNEAIGGVSESLSNYQNEVSAYLRFDSDGVLTLGKSDENFKTTITNQRMSFYDGNTEVAYISNQSLNITNASISQELSMGPFYWIVTDTGLGIRWKGN